MSPQLQCVLYADSIIYTSQCSYSLAMVKATVCTVCRQHHIYIPVSAAMTSNGESLPVMSDTSDADQILQTLLLSPANAPNLSSLPSSLPSPPQLQVSDLPQLLLLRPHLRHRGRPPGTHPDSHLSRPLRVQYHGPGHRQPPPQPPVQTPHPHRAAGHHR